MKEKKVWINNEKHHLPKKGAKKEGKRNGIKKQKQKTKVWNLWVLICWNLMFHCFRKINSICSWLSLIGNTSQGIWYSFTVQSDPMFTDFGSDFHNPDRGQGCEGVTIPVRESRTWDISDFFLFSDSLTIITGSGPIRDSQKMAAGHRIRESAEPWSGLLAYIFQARIQKLNSWLVDEN